MSNVHGCIAAPCDDKRAAGTSYCKKHKALVDKSDFQQAARKWWKGDNSVMKFTYHARGDCNL